MIFPLFVFRRRPKTRQGIAFVLLMSFCGLTAHVNAQQNVTFGKGKTANVTVSSSSNASNQTGIQTLLGSGYLPNQNAASRFLSQSTFGATTSEIQKVTTTGIEKWVDDQLAMPNSYKIENYLNNLHQQIVDSLNAKNPPTPYTIQTFFLSDWHFDMGWFQGSMTAPDLLRWRVAFALSQIFVTSRVSSFDNNPYALANYYDVLMDNAFTNYRTIIDKITYHPAMAVYLTFLNNRATDLEKQTYPDENYAREIMQLFSIGLYQLNLDGTEKKDVNGKLIPTYNNNDIANLAKVFTGLSWGDSQYLGDRRKSNWSFTKRLKFYPIDSSDAYIRYWIPNPRIVNGHEPGTKTFLGSTIPNRPVAQGEQDIQDALNIIFNHPNVGPFIARRLIQRLVTSNPTPAYIQRVATAFNNNGAGVRGDMKAVVKAILLDPEARDCCSCSNDYSGQLKEPLLRYMNLVKGANLTAQGGVFRNAMRTMYDKMGQLPMFSPSVFNFFSPDYIPDGVMKEAGKYGPEFQLFNSQTYTGYMNLLNRWLIDDEPVEYYQHYSGEVKKTQEQPPFNFADDYSLTRDDKLVRLLDKYNLILAHGSLSSESLNNISTVISQMPYTEDSNGVPNATYASRRVRIAILLIMSSPEYIINK